MAAALSNGEWKPAAHLAVIDYEFRNLLKNDEIDVLIITCPPRHGKSQYLSKWAPAWFHLNYPSKRSILTSHTKSLCVDNSRWVRDKVHELSPMFGHRGINPRHSANADWGMFNHDGGMIAAGVAGALTGYGGDLIVVDDFLKDAEQASSQSTRNKQWDWFQTVVLTRRSPTGKVIILATPWHRDDLIGRLTSGEYKHELRVRLVRLQALREHGIPDPLNRPEGAALWPKRFDEQALLRIKGTLFNHWWAAMYQCRPGNTGRTAWPDEYFQDIWVPDDLWPDKFEISAASLDPSLGKDQKRGDYSAATFAGWTRKKLWIDSDIERRPVPRMMNDFVKLCLLHEPSVIGLESNGFQTVLEGPFDDACQAYRYNGTLNLINNSVKKDHRIERLGTWLANGEMKFRDTPSNRLLVDQLREFPTHQFDDGPDSLEQTIRVLCQASADLQDRANEGTIQLSTN